MSRFLSFVDVSFESLNMCISFGIPTEARKLVKGSVRCFELKEDRKLWCKVEVENGVRGGRVK